MYFGSASEATVDGQVALLSRALFRRQHAVVGEWSSQVVHPLTARNKRVCTHGLSPSFFCQKPLLRLASSILARVSGVLIGVGGRASLGSVPLLGSKV